VGALKTFRVNEIFSSIQGEGVRAGTANLFLRFSGCNLKCSEDDEYSGFFCDTEFSSGRDLTIPEIINELNEADEGDCKSIVLTGGEPALQLDAELISALKAEGYYLAIETNGTIALPAEIDWVTVSPKSAEHTLAVRAANELKYVRRKGQGIPRPVVTADHYLISPAFEADGSLKRETLEWCVGLVKTNPRWRLSLQLHKWLNVR
jgi:7-carboxy-7-deazaguanine synthase